MLSQSAALRAAFIVGAITDAMALIALLVPAVARLLWGPEIAPNANTLITGYAASLMLGWTALLLWAYQRPLERRGVAALTLLVICGLVLAEVVAVLSGQLPAWRMLPTWCIQAVLLALFGWAYCHGRIYHRTRA